MGSPPTFPSLVGVGGRLTAPQMASVIHQGKGRMPGFPNLNDDQLNALIGFLASGESKELQSSQPPPPGMRYRFTGYDKFLDPRRVSSGRASVGNVERHRPEYR